MLDRALVIRLKTEAIVLRRCVPLRRRVPLPRGLPPKRIVPVRKMRSQPRRGPGRSPEYLAWIRTLGCGVCARVSGGATVVEAAHTNVLGRRGIGQKTRTSRRSRYVLSITERIRIRTIGWASQGFRTNMALT